MTHHRPGGSRQRPDMQARALVLRVGLRKQPIRPQSQRQAKQSHEPKHGMPPQSDVDPTADDRRYGRSKRKQHSHETQQLLSLRALEEVADDGTANDHSDTGADSLQGP